MSAIQMVCDDCGAHYMAGMVGSTPWPSHRCRVRALREAIRVMKCRMANDDRRDEPYDEDMAQSIAECYRAVGDAGDEEAANEWYRPDGARPRAAETPATNSGEADNQESVARRQGTGQ